MNILLVDVGNTNTHLGLATDQRVRRQSDVPTAQALRHDRWLSRFLGREPIDGAIIASVVPRATAPIGRAIRKHTGLRAQVLTVETDLGIGVRYPKPRQIGP